MVILHVDFTGTFNEEMLYHENLLTEYHVKDGHSVTILTTCYKFNNDGEVCHEKPDDKIMKNGVRLIRKDYHHIICQYITKKIRKVDGVYKILEQIDPDVIFVHGTQTFELLSVIKFLKQNSRVKLFVDNHADFTNSASNFISLLFLHKIFWRFISLKAVPYTNKFFGTTPARADFMAEVYGIPRNKIELLLPCADSDRITKLKDSGIRKSIRTSHGFCDNHLVIITGGKIDNAKTEIINLVRVVYFHDSDKIRLLVFGSIEKEIHDILKPYLEDPKILYLGWLNSDEIIGYFLASDLAIFPGRHSVLWEHAVGAGLPCVFKYWRGFTHPDLGGNCIFLYKNDEDEMREILTGIVNGSISYADMKKVAEHKGAKVFSCKEIARRAIQSESCMDLN